MDEKLELRFYQYLLYNLGENANAGGFFFKSGSRLRVKFNERLWMQLCLNWKLIDWERPDLLLYLGDKSSHLNWCKYKKKTFMKRTCQLYNNGRFSPGWWQFSASSGKTNNWQMRKIKQRRDFFSNCTSFLLCCVDQTLWWYWMMLSIQILKLIEWQLLKKEHLDGFQEIWMQIKIHKDKIFIL